MIIVSNVTKIVSNQMTEKSLVIRPLNCTLNYLHIIGMGFNSKNIYSSVQICQEIFDGMRMQNERGFTRRKNGSRQCLVLSLIFTDAFY